MQKLKVSKISSVDLVDEGSCGSAHITLFKRKDGTTMGFEEIMKSLTADEQAVVNAEIEKAKGQVPEGFMSPEEVAALEAKKEEAENAVTKMKGEIEDLKKSANAGQQSEEEILKNANLDPAVKALLERSLAKSKAAEEVIVKMKEESEKAEFIAKAKEVSFVPEAETKVVELLKSIKGVSGAGDQVMEILKSVNTLISKGAAFKEMGSNHTAGNTGTTSEEAWANIEKAASALVVKGTVSKAKAIDMVILQQPELYNAYVEALRNE